MPNILKPEFKITRTRSSQRNFTVIIRNFWACSCRPIHKRLLLCCLAGLHVLDRKLKKDKRKKNLKPTFKRDINNKT